ncbi:MAG: CapA family protein [Archangiaceae bacterium]|nr:CapA family protein [Archangiaceae bacterium]
MLLCLIIAAAPTASVDLVFTGDVIPHTSVKQTAARHARVGPDGKSLNHDGWDHVFGPLSDAFRRADVAVVNLETPITSGREPATGELVFNARPSLARALAAVGVTIATFANNHARDQDLDGIVQTRKHLRAAGLKAVGAAPTEREAWQPLCFEQHGLKLCFIAFTRFMNGLHNEADEAAPFVPIVDYAADRSTGGISEGQLLRKVRETAARCDAVFVTPHWGEEYFLEPLQADRRLAAALVDAGAVAVIGNHPHVLQAVETVTRADGREALVAYSLGNLVSSQGADDMDTRRDGLMLSLTVTAGPDGVSVTKVKPVPVWTDNRGDQGIQPVLADEEISAMSERRRLLEARADVASLKEYRALGRRLSKATQRRERILKVLPAALLRDEGGAELSLREGRRP